jgi:hypothetical protein
MQKLVLVNDTPRPLEVMVEINPDRYVLQPKDEMLIEGEPIPAQDHFQIAVYEGGIQIYAPGITPEKVSINGAPAKPNWGPLPDDSN